MEANASNPGVHEPLPGTGLGERLIAAREARELTLAVVAHKLRLSAATLKALESDRFEDLPEPIFVRGYLRAYARLLGMDTEVFVVEYDRLVDTSEPVLEPTSGIRRRSPTRARYLRGATVLLVVVAVVMLGTWWYSRLKHDIPTRFQIASSEADQPVSPASVPPSPESDSPNPDLGPVPMLSPDTPPQSLASAAAGEGVGAVKPEPLIAETAVATGPPLPHVSELPVSADADAAVQRRDVGSTVEPSVPDLPIAPLASEHGRLVKASRAPVGEDVLLINANDESWADIVDANGYQLLYYPLRPGMVLRLQGQAPLRVYLGNAPAVDVSLNQKRFDHTPFHRRNSTARFTVSASP